MKHRPPHEAQARFQIANYIPPYEREAMRNTIVLAEPAGLHTKLNLSMALDSHAVLDSIAADLAGCLRESIDIFMDVKDQHPYDSLTPQTWELALARYDALHMEAGQ